MTSNFYLPKERIQTGIMRKPCQLMKKLFWTMFIIFLAAISHLFLITEAGAKKNQIIQVNIISESINQVTLNVRYYYGGNFGGNVFMNALMAKDGKASPHYAVRPGKVEIGRGSTKVVLGVNQSAPRQFSTDQLLVSMYKGGGKEFLEGLFSFPKTWSKPGNRLMPILKAVRMVKPVIMGSTADSIKPSDIRARQRRILANGKVEIQFPDGRKKRFYEGGFDIVTRKGEESSYLFASAQPPTPPSAPPDDRHFAWLGYENDRLLEIIKLLVGNDKVSVNNYLKKEGPYNSYYLKISSRRRAIKYLLSE